MNGKALLREAKALEGQMVADRRVLHERAETGFDLPQTFDYVWKQLREMGIEPQKCGRCGIVCAIGRPGRTFLLRADMDALPIREDTGLPFACKSGSMHACGHDMHTAMLLAAAQLLKKHESELQGTVKLMFQPAEELLAGAMDMVESGVLEHPRVDAALMLHVMAAQDIPTGVLVIPAPGVSAPAAGNFSIRIQGRGSHGAMPHAGVDPINVAAHTIVALQAISARELPMSEPAALTIGSLRAGDAANAIPDEALLQGSYRGFADDVVELLRRRVAEISGGVAQVFRAEAQVEFHASCPTLINDAALAVLAGSYLAELLGPGGVYSAVELAGSAVSRASGSEDFAVVSHRVPSLMLALAAGRPEDGHIHPLHHPRASFDEAALVPGAAAYAWFAMRWLVENG